MVPQHSVTGPTDPKRVANVSRRLRSRSRKELQRYMGLPTLIHLPCTIPLPADAGSPAGVPHDLEGTHPEGKQRSTFYVRTFSAQPPTSSSVKVPPWCYLVVARITVVVKSGLKPLKRSAYPRAEAPGLVRLKPHHRHRGVRAVRSLSRALTSEPMYFFPCRPPPYASTR